MNLNGFLLSETVSAVEGLGFDGLGPGEVEGNDVVCADQVQTDTASLVVIRSREGSSRGVITTHLQRHQHNGNVVVFHECIDGVSAFLRVHGSLVANESLQRTSLATAVSWMEQATHEFLLGEVARTKRQCRRPLRHDYSLRTTFSNWLRMGWRNNKPCRLGASP